jgi:quercetin dioxygenase-like cupin family protein
MGMTKSEQNVNVKRRTIVIGGLAGASALLAVNGQSFAQPIEKKGKVDRKEQKPVDSMIPGFSKVRLREMTYAPGASGKAKMQNAMICECSQGSLEVTADDKKFTVNKGDVWTCSAGMVEGISNKGSTPGTMRVFDLLTS